MNTNTVSASEATAQIRVFNQKPVLTKKKPEMGDFLESIDDMRLTFSMIITEGTRQELIKNHRRDLEIFLHAILAFERQFALFQQEGPKGGTLDNMNRLKDVSSYRNQIIALIISHERWEEVRERMRY